MFLCFDIQASESLKIPECGLQGIHFREVSMRNILLLFLSLNSVKGANSQHNNPSKNDLGNNVQKGICSSLIPLCDQISAFCKGPHNGISCTDNSENSIWKQIEEKLDGLIHSIITPDSYIFWHRRSWQKVLTFMCEIRLNKKAYAVKI